MSGQCIEKIKIDGHTYQVFMNEDNTYSAYSFSQGKYCHDPYKDKPAGYKPVFKKKTQEEIDEEISDIFDYPTLDLEGRKIRSDVLKRFDIRTGVSEADGETITTIHFPYYKGEALTGWKTKLIQPKNFWSVGDTKGCDLFGWKEALNTGAPKLFITEGELDAVALYQMLKDKNKGTKWASLEPAVVSLTSGIGHAKEELVKWANQINKQFKEVVLVFDMDEAGRKGAHDVVSILPEVKVAELPMKDAGECLMHGRVRGAVNAVLFKAVKPKNTRIVRGSSLREKAKRKPEWGLSYPWQGLTDLTRGRRTGENVYWGAGVKMGKSELVNALAEHIIVQHDKPVLLVKPEEDMVRTYKMLVSKAAGKIFHDPKVEFDEVAFDKAEPLIGDKALIIDNYQFVDWDVLKGDIRYAVTGEGVEDIIIDPITCMTNHLSSSEANEFLVEMTSELASMSKDLHFRSDIFCHLKAPQQGEPHERGGKVLSTQFAGSRAMMRSCHYMIGLQGDKDPEKSIEERNLRDLVVLEDREFGETGIVPLYWDYHTALFNEIKG